MENAESKIGGVKETEEPAQSVVPRVEETKAESHGDLEYIPAEQHSSSNNTPEDTVHAPEDAAKNHYNENGSAIPAVRKHTRKSAAPRNYGGVTVDVILRRLKEKDLKFVKYKSLHLPLNLCIP